MAAGMGKKNNEGKKMVKCELQKSGLDHKHNVSREAEPWVLTGAMFATKHLSKAQTGWPQEALKMQQSINKLHKLNK